MALLGPVAVEEEVVDVRTGWLRRRYLDDGLLPLSYLSLLHRREETVDVVLPLIEEGGISGKRLDILPPVELEPVKSRAVFLPVEFDDLGVHPERGEQEREFLSEGR